MTLFNAWTGLYTLRVWAIGDVLACPPGTALIALQFVLLRESSAIYQTFFYTKTNFNQPLKTGFNA
jgi:hypothetical protein